MHELQHFIQDIKRKADCPEWFEALQSPEYLDKMLILIQESGEKWKIPHVLVLFLWL